MKYTSISHARTALRGTVLIWYPFNHGGQLVDRWMWMAEKDREVVDYHSKDTLIAQALAAGDKVAVLCIHRDSTVSARLLGEKQDANLL